MLTTSCRCHARKVRCDVTSHMPCTVSISTVIDTCIGIETDLKSRIVPRLAVNVVSQR